MPEPMEAIPFEDMECGRLLIRHGRSWLKLTEVDVDRGARAVVRDCQYRGEIARCALRRAENIEDRALHAAIIEAWERLDDNPCVCGRDNGSRGRLADPITHGMAENAPCCPDCGASDLIDLRCPNCYPHGTPIPALGNGHAETPEDPHQNGS